MIGFFIGLFVGGFFGVAIMCCLNVASKADDQMERGHFMQDFIRAINEAMTVYKSPCEP